MAASAALPETILKEILDRVFAGVPRALLLNLLLNALAAWISSDALPPALLALWGCFAVGVTLVRMQVATEYRRRRPAGETLQAFARRLAAGHALGGAAWGSLGAMALLAGQGQVGMMVFVMFVLVCTTLATSPDTYPASLHAYLAAGMLPIVSAALVHPGQVARFITLLGVLFSFSAIFLARQAHRTRVESIHQRAEHDQLLEDLTVQKEALDEAVRSRTRFLAAASHDLRQPLQAITLLVEGLRERTRGSEVHGIVDHIGSSVATMAALLNAILDISRFDSGTVHPERSHFRMNFVLERLRRAYGEAAARKGLRLDVVPCSAVVESDNVLLYRILSNLTENAVRHTGRGRVLVGCRRRAGAISIEVWDTGPGIPEGQRAEIFREFTQLANPHRDREQGLGLGLAIVDRTARLLGHPLRLRSWPGRGTVFALEVRLGDPALVKDLAPPSPEPTALAGCTVLVVEDQAEVREAMTTLLGGWGCSVHAVASGAEVAPLVARLSAAPDVVVADYRLPGGEDGIAVIDAIRREHPGTGGILVSGDIAPEVLRRAQDSGYVLLHKPLRPARLRALLGTLWRHRGERAPRRASGAAS